MRKMNQTAKHIVFVGRVQGVGFRFTALRIADRYKLRGWVRNALDGTVEMIAQGSSEALDNCIRDIQESFAGYIRETNIEEVPANPQYNDFKITF